MRNKEIRLFLPLGLIALVLVAGCLEDYTKADNILPLNGTIKVKDGVYQTESAEYEGFLIVRGFVVNTSERHDHKRSILNFSFADGQQLSALDSYSNFNISNSMARIIICNSSNGCGGQYYEGYVIKIK